MVMFVPVTMRFKVLQTYLIYNPDFSITKLLTTALSHHIKQSYDPGTRIGSKDSNPALENMKEGTNFRTFNHIFMFYSLRFFILF